MASEVVLEVWLNIYRDCAWPMVGTPSLPPSLNLVWGRCISKFHIHFRVDSFFEWVILDDHFVLCFVVFICVNFVAGFWLLRSCTCVICDDTIQLCTSFVIIRNTIYEKLFNFIEKYIPLWCQVGFMHIAKRNLTKQLCRYLLVFEHAGVMHYNRFPPSFRAIRYTIQVRIIHVILVRDADLFFW